MQISTFSPKLPQYIKKDKLKGTKACLNNKLFQAIFQMDQTMKLKAI
jgi:hypothetical protein